uniref:Uncharacterized protein n=2 Tax=Ditylenchus dipsaci TaxID=166011 RepID=A0A915DXA9_9BILA
MFRPVLLLCQPLPISVYIITGMNLLQLPNSYHNNGYNGYTNNNNNPYYFPDFNQNYGGYSRPYYSSYTNVPSSIISWGNVDHFSTPDSIYGFFVL